MSVLCMLRPSLLIALVLGSVSPDASLNSTSNTAELTFGCQDPVSGVHLTCAQCPPGRFLRERCTAERDSVCEECPPGSFTALWNHINRCLSCGVCGRNMVETTRCSRQRDCACECKHGYYYRQRAGMCVRWSQCGTGHGVSQPGSPHVDSVCAPCPDGTFSNTVSSESSCVSHTNCSSINMEAVVKGNSWHDNVCSTCIEAQSQDPLQLGRPLLASFFAHHELSLRRLRHVVSMLPPSGGTGTHRRALSSLNQGQLQTRLEQWISETSLEHLRTLPPILSETGAMHTAEKLRNKLTRIQTGLNQVCPRSVLQPRPIPFLL
ncbi:unnamed protein product [Knipowitschia caucasica]